MIAPDSFQLDDVDGHAHAATDIVAGEYRDVVQEAARSCPEQAIEIVAEASDRARAERNGAVL